jgi:hypothetical protein
MFLSDEVEEVRPLAVFLHLHRVVYIQVNPKWLVKQHNAQ